MLLDLVAHGLGRRVHARGGGATGGGASVLPMVLVVLVLHACGKDKQAAQTET